MFRNTMNLYFGCIQQPSLGLKKRLQIRVYYFKDTQRVSTRNQQAVTCARALTILPGTSTVLSRSRPFKYIYLHIKNTLKLTGPVERSFAFSMANWELFEGLMLCKSDSWRSI